MHGRFSENKLEKFATFTLNESIDRMPQILFHSEDKTDSVFIGIPIKETCRKIAKFLKISKVGYQARFQLYTKEYTKSL